MTAQHRTPVAAALGAPELNPVENVRQYLRQTWLSNRIFDTYTSGC